MRIDRIALIAEMARQDISAVKLAEKAGLSRFTITAIRGGKGCSMETAVRIAEALSVPLDKLMEGISYGANR